MHRHLATALCALPLLALPALPGCSMTPAPHVRATVPSWLDKFERGLPSTPDAQGLARAETRTPDGSHLSLIWSRDSSAFVAQLTKLQGEAAQVLYDERDPALGQREVRQRLPDGQVRAYIFWMDAQQVMRLAVVQASTEGVARETLAAVQALRSAGRFGGQPWLATPSTAPGQQP